MTPIAKAILGEANVPAHWGNLPGYGQVADPKKTPPYTEDLGGGVTHEVSIDGTEEWKLNGEYHSVDGYPAISADGYQAWYDHGKLHRDGDQPAIVNSPSTNNVQLHWYQHDQEHRDGDKPAFIRLSQGRPMVATWYQHGNRHRDGNKPAMVKYQDTVASWFIEGRRARTDGGPELIENNTGTWYRDTGPKQVIARRSLLDDDQLQRWGCQPGDGLDGDLGVDLSLY